MLLTLSNPAMLLRGIFSNPCPHGTDDALGGTHPAWLASPWRLSTSWHLPRMLLQKTHSKGLSSGDARRYGKTTRGCDTVARDLARQDTILQDTRGEVDGQGAGCGPPSAQPHEHKARASLVTRETGSAGMRRAGPPLRG